MSKKVRLGLILTLLVAILFVSVQHIGILPLPTHEQNKKLVATYEQKQENKRIATTYAKVGFGYSQRNVSCLITLWTRESRFDNYASNPKSSAYGIAQLLGETSSDVRIQSLRALRYISVRYGTACRALAFHNRHGYY